MNERSDLMVGVPNAHHVGGGTSVLDIGGEVGALVVHLPAVPRSGEIEACPKGRPDRRFHTGVHLRDVGGRMVPVALYPSITEGDYEILDDELRVIGCAHITGGEVAELRL